jgi:hypothetical protein
MEWCARLPSSGETDRARPTKRPAPSALPRAPPPWSTWPAPPVQQLQSLRRAWVQRLAALAVLAALVVLVLPGETRVLQQLTTLHGGFSLLKAPTVTPLSRMPFNPCPTGSPIAAADHLTAYELQGALPGGLVERNHSGGHIVAGSSQAPDKALSEMQALVLRVQAYLRRWEARTAQAFDMEALDGNLESFPSGGEGSFLRKSFVEALTGERGLIHHLASMCGIGSLAVGFHD